MDLNRIELIGRVVATPEVSGEEAKKRARFTLAVNRTFKNSKGEYTADFFKAIAWRKLADVAAKLKKGDTVLLIGSLYNNNYTDKDGVQRYDNEISVDQIRYLKSPKAAE